MADKKVGNTALGAAICRLIEQYQPEQSRLFQDPVVKEIVGAPLRMMMQMGAMRNLTVKQTEAVMQGIYGAQVCRTRYIDDTVKAALAAGIGQLVLLGAGLDTRPYRLPGIEQVKVFEVDLPAVQADKKKKVQGYLGRLPQNVTYIPIDFDTQTLESVFTGSAFDPSKPAVFVWEGVTQYITQEAVSRTLAFVGKSAPGGVMLFTYVLKSIIERRSDIPGAEHMVDVVGKSSPWIFGLDPHEIPAFVKPFHLTLVADVGDADYQKKYLAPLGRKLDVFAGERIVHVTVD